MAESGDGPEDGRERNRRSVRAFLLGAPWAAVSIPVLFYLRFGRVDAFALSFTGFVVVLCLLAALGFYGVDKMRFRTRAAKGGWLDYVGAFWLLACAFGPFFGWLVTAPEFALTLEDWVWRYVVRVALSMGLPVVTALPLLRYVRGGHWHVALLLLLGVTSLAAWSGLNTLLDLRDGPKVTRTTGYYDAPNNSFYPSAEGRPFKLTTLAHTQRTIRIEPAPTDEGRD